MASVTLFKPETKKVNITFEYLTVQPGQYKGEKHKIDVTSIINFDEMINKLIPAELMLQSPKQNAWISIKTEVESRFRPHRTKSKSGSKLKKVKKDKKDKSKSVKRSRKPRRQ